MILSIRILVLVLLDLLMHHVPGLLHDLVDETAVPLLVLIPKIHYGNFWEGRRHRTFYRIILVVSVRWLRQNRGLSTWRYHLG